MSQHYRLLGINAEEFTGPLARAMAGQVAERPFLLKALLTLSRVRRNQDLELLGMTCHVDEHDRFHACPTGLLRLTGRKIVAGMEQAVNAKGSPILRRDDQLVFTASEPAIPGPTAVKALAGRLVRRSTGYPLPETATIRITALCQADCYHCSSARHRHKPHPELSTEEWKSILRQIEDLGVANIVFTGGEPLLRRDIFDLIAWIRKDESSVAISTNGILLTKENVRKLADAGLFSLNVSIDSPDPKAHDDLRKVNRCFERAVEGLQRAREAGLVVGVSTYTTPEHLRSGQVMQMIHLARDAGAHELTFADAAPPGRRIMHTAYSLLSDADRDSLAKVAAEWNARRVHPRVHTQSHANGPRGAGCCAGRSMFSLTAYGDMAPCDFTPLAVGNATRESVETLWNRLAEHPAYARESVHCLMQDPAFRARYIDLIPDSGPFPFPIAELDRPSERAEPRAKAA